jgi:iron-sulfur cluster repair protein YtfE (RIC family)
MSAFPTYDPTISEDELDKIANRSISDLIKHAPGTMTVFSMYGLDICCGGGLPLGEALARHEIKAQPVLREVAAIVAESQDW